MKIIHLTDSHVIGGAGVLYGGRPADRLAQAVASINADHADADLAVITGDLTHWGDEDAYAAFAAALSALRIPVHLMVGNHDVTSAFARAFPQVPRDPYGFVQAALETPRGRFLLLDTSLPGSHAGAYCEARLDWLDTELKRQAGPLFLFMHHPPFEVGIPAMDAIMLQNAEAFFAVIAPHKQRIRHLFFGHVHRAISGNWRGISYSCMRGLNHQVALNLSTAELQANMEPPAYGVVLIRDDSVVVHLNECNAHPTFNLIAPDGTDPVAYATDPDFPVT